MVTQLAIDGLAPALPEGFAYHPDAIPVDEEKALVDACSALAPVPARHRGYLGKRRVASFGSGYDFERNALTDAPAIPAFLVPLRERVAAYAAVEAASLSHALVTEYREGTELGWHRDVPDFEVVAGVSLLSACRMRLRPYPPAPGARARTVDIVLAPRSLYVMRGIARWRWQHAIAPTPSLRYSITFRTARRHR